MKTDCSGVALLIRRLCVVILGLIMIAMTANAFSEDVQASIEAGMDGHLSQSIVIEELIQTINRNLNR